MAENDPQYRCITDTRFALEQRYRDHPQVYVGADLLIYYVEGDPGKSVAPDVLVSFGVPQGNRRYYLLWEEGKAPDVVFEFASPSSWQADVGWKRGLYQGLGIREYFIFDPTGEHLDPLLRGYRLVREIYEPLPLIQGERGLMGLMSEVLGLELWVKENGGAGMPYVLRLYDPGSGEWLRTPEEEAEARRAAEARAAAAEARAAALQAELERLRAERG